jgi:L-aspartate oxidase
MNYHELGALAPRDVVSRSIFREMAKLNEENVYLDITHVDKEYLKNRFPNIYKTCLEYGIDITKDFIPVAPAEHYCMGGIKTDVYGQTNIDGFFACGETACNGIHGANRLASNSLLEGLVFGSEIGKRVTQIISQNTKTKKFCKFNSVTKRLKKDIDAIKIKEDVKNIMNEYVGIIRNETGLMFAHEKLEEYYKLIKDIKNETSEDFELQNIVLLSKLVIESAIKRKESRGAHYRSDFMQTDDLKWKKNIVIGINKE